MRRLLFAYRGPTQDNHPGCDTDLRIAVAMPMAGHTGPAFLCRRRLFRLMRKLPGPDGKLRACARDVHSIFYRKILHQSRARQKAHTEDERIPGYGHILHPGTPCSRLHPHRPSCSSRNNPYRRHNLRIPYMHHDAARAIAKKQPLRPRRRDLRLLRFHPRLEQVRGAGSIPQLPCPGPILPGPVAHLHPRHPIPRRPGNAHHAVLILLREKGTNLLPFSLVTIHFKGGI